MVDANAVTDPRIPLTVRQKFSIGKSWKGNRTTLADQLSSHSPALIRSPAQTQASHVPSSRRESVCSSSESLPQSV